MTDRLTILLVDDSRTIRASLRLQLQDLPVTLVEADNASRALSLARLLRPVGAIVDLHLPDMDGVELTRELRAQQGTGPRMTILLLTADATDEWRKKAALAGVDSVLQKPISGAILRSEIESVLENAHEPAAAAAGR